MYCYYANKTQKQFWRNDGANLWRAGGEHHHREFESQEKNKATVYVCGPTVYDNAHLGHARSSIVFDLLHRVLKVNGYQVTMTKNFTDIDDKIINKMKDTSKSLEEIIKSFEKKSMKKAWGLLRFL